MSGIATADGSHRRGAGRMALLFALATAMVVAAVAIVALVLPRPAGAEAAARQPVRVESSRDASTTGWSISAPASLISTDGHTRIQARLVRKSDEASTPALTGNFDGSGGGEAKLITCAAPAREWAVAVGGTQGATLSCDQYVEAFAVHQLKYVYINAKQ